jgi:hypothetical protein
VVKISSEWVTVQIRVSPVVGLELGDRTKIVIDNKIIEKVNLFNYLGNMISYEKIGY